MKTITITPKDLEKYKITNTDKGNVINELAYSAGEWTETDLWENNVEYEPNEPYNYNYEDDLFTKTKTLEALFELTNTLAVDTREYPLDFDVELQAGAFMALKHPELWNVLLEAYKEKLQEDRTDGISPEYNKTLQDEIDSFYRQQQKEWLYGDYRNYAGVVKMIARYFTEEADGDYNEKKDEYTFALNDYDVEKYTEDGIYSESELKPAMLDAIKNRGESRKYKDKQESEKRKAEREKEREYKKARAEEAQNERREKLLAMKIK